MSCKASADLLSLRLDGLLDASKSYELDDHLKNCADCRGTWNGLQEADLLLRLSAKQPLAPPPDFLMKVMVKVAATPVTRPALWDRVRVEGGRRTTPLTTGRRATLPLGAPALPVAAAARPTARRGPLAALQNRWVQAYLGGLGAAAALALLALVVVTTLLTVGGAPVTALVSHTPVGPFVVPSLDVARAWLGAVEHLLTAWLAGVDWLLVGVIGLALAGGTALWMYLVQGFLRRDDGGRIEA
jgi:hypothetical protein